MANNSAKGSTFERDICKRLSLWWTDNDRDDVFWRTSGSGARATTRAKQNKTTYGQCGDIQATDPIGDPLMKVFAIEIKRGYPNATLSNAFDAAPKSKPQIIDFIKQAMKSQNDSDAISWMLIHKRNRRQTTVLVPRTILEYIHPQFFDDMSVIQIELLLKEQSINVVQCCLDDFLEWLEPDDIRNLL